MNRKAVCALIGIIYGLSFFLMFYGYKIINPTYTGWIFQKGGDIATHQLGWEFYRNSEWLWPIGCYYGYPYPLKNSIIFTDSVPLFALFFKCFRNILPSEFQYWGLWGVFSFCLQGVVSARLLNRLKIDLRLIFFAEPFFFINVLLAFRMFMHSALGGQWIILIALSEFINGKEKKLINKVAIWATILITSVLIQPYFLFMNGIVMLGDALLWIIKGDNKVKGALAIIIIPCISVLLTIYLLGGFEIGDFVDTGLGDLTVNINGFFNPMGHSSFLRDLPYLQYQYEGICYLGLGVITILLFSCLVGKTPSIRMKIEWIPLVVVIVILFMLSIGPKITIGDMVILDYSSILPKVLFRVWSIIRSCGRMIWPVWYMIIIGIIYRISKIERKQEVIYAVLLISAVLQYVDVIPKTITNVKIYENKYDCEIWDPLDRITLQNSKDTIIYLSEGLPAQKYIDVAYYASRHKMAITTGFFARASISHLADIYKAGYIERLRNNDIRKNEVYVINKDYISSYLLSMYNSNNSEVNVLETPNYLVVYSGN